MLFRCWMGSVPGMLAQQSGIVGDRQKKKPATFNHGPTMTEQSILDIANSEPG